MKHFCPSNEINHQIKTRNAKHFKVFHDHNEIMKNIQIIYLQNQPNNELKRKNGRRKKSGVIDKLPESSDFYACIQSAWTLSLYIHLKLLFTSTYLQWLGAYLLLTKRYVQLYYKHTKLTFQMPLNFFSLPFCYFHSQINVFGN